VCKRTAKTFDLVKIRAKSVEIWAKCANTLAKSLYILCFYKHGTQNQSADVFVFGGHVLYSSLRASLGEILAKVVLVVL